MIALHEAVGSVSFAIKVHPRAKRNAIQGEIGDALKVSLAAPPTDGKANDACVKFLAVLLRVPRSSVSIISGQSSRTKTVRIDGIAAAELRSRLQIGNG